MKMALVKKRLLINFNVHVLWKFVSKMKMNLLNFLDEVLKGMLQMEMIEEHAVGHLIIYKIFNQV